ncbi:kinesin-like protein KIN-12F isoform X1 [Elaeis guineensis]|uniref:Kinesin-like protein KIN-12F isoform X2 n=1 Tax=Elaeis guineensis var. tenera TaxID=51953 RepID=A0A6J0PCG6_ELAGV|nr:kinesin-like protein KIN-12F isoform X2 [Elaeis guineensis]
MLRDLRIFRRNSGKFQGGNNENVPVGGSESATSQRDSDSSRDPLNAIQECVLNPKPGVDQGTISRRKAETTPSKNQTKGSDSQHLPFRTPEKPAAGRNRFGWVAKGEHGAMGVENGDELSHQGPSQLPPLSRGPSLGIGGGYSTNTPRSYRAAGKASSVHSDSSSTQSTPSKSVTKPTYSGFSGSRPPLGLGNRMMSFSMASKGITISSTPPTVVNTAEVPHFELKEEPSFWMDNNVQVVIRVRPLNSTEQNLQGYHRCLKQESAQSITWIGQPETRFTFDYVACETINQEMLFRVAGLPMVENCMSGYNSCIFAYGQTGSGKTYTMLGEISELEVSPSPDRGMTPRIFEFLFARIRAEEESRRDEKLKYNCRCSFLEIYNEQITDLLDPFSTNLLLREDIRKGVYVENLTEFEVESVNDILKLLMQGAANRKVAATNMNRESSRSHSVFTCVIESRWEKDSTSNLRFARLNLVDLAGSERQKTSGAEGERLKEAANINKSLSTLGHVIMVLADVAHGKQRHVPYRDSRLTFLLQDSLGGNSKTMIIANVSPSICSASETLSTLKFAQRARLIQNNAVVNEDASGDVIALQHQIRLLKEELSVLKHQKVSRSLSFRKAVFEDFENEACDVSDVEKLQGVAEVDADESHHNETWHSIRVSAKQLKSLEATLTGALRREKMADNAIKQLEAEIEQLNRLVRQREEDTRCTKMMLKFREDKIHRMEDLLKGLVTTDSYLQEENNALSEQVQLLHARVDRNPEVTRFALENIRLLDQLRKYQDFYEEGEREIILTEVSELRNQLLHILDGKSEHEQHHKLDMEPKEAGQPQLDSLAREKEALSIELKKTSQELENCRINLKSCLELNEKLTREISNLHTELNNIKSTNNAQHVNVNRNIESCSESTQTNSQAHGNRVQCPLEMKLAEEILNLQLELDILKTILGEEKSSRVEVEKRATHANDELTTANGRILQISKQHEDLSNELKDARSVIEALESQHVLLINELEKLRDNNNHYIELLKNQEQDISTLRKKLDGHFEGKEKPYFANEEFTCQSFKHFENEDSPLQVKLKKMQDSLEKARNLNMRYQGDQVSQTSLEQEMDEVRRQVEVETAEVIVCLQEELMALQQQVDDSSRNELMAKQGMVALEREIKDLHEGLCLVKQENERLCELVEEKDRDLRSMTDDWERLAYEIADILTDGNTALEEASEQVACISESFPQRSWISEKIERMIESLSQKDMLIEELQNCLQDAQDVRCDMEWKLRSLRGATLAITEAQQQESMDKEKEILQLTSQLSEKTSLIVDLENNIKLQKEQIRKSEVCSTVAFIVVSRLSEINTAHLQELEHVKLLLDESTEMILQKDSLLQCQMSLHADAEKQIQDLSWQLEKSQGQIAEILRHVQEQEQAQALECLKKEEEEVALSKIVEDLSKAKTVINEFELGVSTLHACMRDSVDLADGPAEVHDSGKYSNEWAGNNSEDRIESNRVVNSNVQNNVEWMSGCSTGSAIGKNANESECRMLLKDDSDRETTILLLRKELECALDRLQEVQAQMIKLLNKKEEIKKSEKQSQTSIEHLTNEVLRLKSDIIDKEIQFDIRLQELEDKLQKVKKNAIASSECWCKAKEVLELEINDAKAVAAQKTIEASVLLAKIEEAQETMRDADFMINALMQANEIAKFDIERHQKIETTLNCERNSLLNEVQSLQSSIHMKEQEYKLMEKNFQSNLIEANSLVLELMDSFKHLQTVFTEKFKFLVCDLEWLKAQVQHFAQSARSWLEEIWSEIIGKDCAVSVLHLCHMGILLERLTGLNAENGFLHRGLSESNSVIADLREHNIKAKKELEMCSILKGKLLVDINNSFNRISKKEDETSEFRARLGSFEKKILHLQLLEESMLARSNSMGTELSILVKELEANNRNALTAKSVQDKTLREKEELYKQLENASRLLDGIQSINGMFRDSLLEDLSLLVADSHPECQLKLEALKSGNMGSIEEFELYRILISCRTESVVINLFAKDIEVLVVQSEMEQNMKEIDHMASQITDLERQRDSFIRIIDKIKMEMILNNIDKDQKSSEMHSLLLENEKLRNDLLKMKEEHFRVTEHLQEMETGFAPSLSHINAINQENHRLEDRIFSLETYITNLQTDLDRKNAELDEVLHSQSIISKELDLKTEMSKIQIEQAKFLKSENDSLQNEVRAFMTKKDEITVMLRFRLKSAFDLAQSIDIIVDRMFHLIDDQIVLMMDRMDQENFEQKEAASKFVNELEFFELSIEKLMSEISSLKSELMRKDEVLKGLLFDLSLLQESASIAKDQKDELEEMATALESVEEELASKSCELDEASAHGRMLEAELLEKNEKISALELEIAEKLGKLKLVYTENLELKAELENIIGIKNSTEEELREKIKAAERLEEEILEMSSLLGQRDHLLEDLQSDMTKLADERDHLDSEVLDLKEKLEMAKALVEENEAIATEAHQLAEAKKAYAEEKEEEVKLLERSVEELECTVYALENKVDIVKAEAERQRRQREELEMELQAVRCQMLMVPASSNIWNTTGDHNDPTRPLKQKITELEEAQRNVQILQKEVAEKDAEIVQCKAHISELNMHAEAQAREYKQKFKELEAMAQQVKTDPASFNATSLTSAKSEKSAPKSRGSGSPFKCIGLGLVQQMNLEKDEDLIAARHQIGELEALAASRQKEIFMLNTRLAAAESMTHDVIRDLLGVKLDMTNYASLLDNHQTLKVKETARHGGDESQEKEQEGIKLRKQLHEFIAERQSWLDEINQRHKELVAARVTVEKLRQRDQFISTENEMLKVENANYKKMTMELEDEVKKFSSQQNLQQRIHHHAKIKEENSLLRLQNEDLNAKLHRLEAVLSRLEEELARHRASSGKNPYVDIDEEERLRRKLQDSEEDRIQLAQKLSSLSSSILKVAGLTQSASDISPLAAQDALDQIKDRVRKLENEVEDLILKCKILREKIRLCELGRQSSPFRWKTDENFLPSSASESPSFSSS